MEKDSPRLILIPVGLVLRAESRRVPEPVADRAPKLGQRPEDGADSRVVLPAERTSALALQRLRPSHSSPDHRAVLGVVPVRPAEPAHYTRTSSPKNSSSS